VVRQIQVARRDAGLHVADTVDVVLTAPPDVLGPVDRHRDYVMAQTLAATLETHPGDTLAVRVTRTGS